ncbi:hypothetical protein B0H19DRAFT_1114824 [Mycena capillaripes]|nr:hypothetical protein B0H19DRAFT_1114824 [Mycena capillaripes]
MQFFALVLAAAIAMTQASNITTFAVIGCSGASAVFPCDGSCHTFVGKNAFKSAAGTCVSMFTGSTCESSDLAFPNPNPNGICEAIESGNPIVAFSCSPTSTCPVS